MNTFPGIVFASAPGGYRLKLTARADLARDRLRLPRNSADVAVIETASREMAQRLRRVLEQVFCSSGSAGLFPSIAAIDDAVGRCRRMGFTSHRAGEEPRQRRPVVGWRQPIIERRRVPDPSMTRAELMHQLEQYPEARWAGYQRSDINLRELIGGLAGVKKRTEVQTQAAAEFRNLAERAQLGAGKATDYTDVRVDVSAHAGNPVADIGQDAREKYGRARKRLGDLASLAERVIVDGDSISETAERLGLGKGGAARDKVTRMVLKATDVLASEFGFVAKGKPGNGIAQWTDGSQQMFTANGTATVISTRRPAIP